MAKDKIKKNVRDFLRAYESMETACCKKFGVRSQGVLAYINRLNGLKNAVGRERYLAGIVSVFDLYQRQMTELKGGSDELFPAPDVEREDTVFCKKFEKLLDRRKDPISVYLQKNKIKRRWRIFGGWALAVLILLLIAAAVYFAVKLL